MSNDQHTRKPGHTPGPWIPWEVPMKHQGIYYQCPIESAHQEGIINVAMAFGATQDECKANARIIADSITISEELERLKAENERYREIIRGFVYYGMIHSVDGVYPAGMPTHRALINDAKTALEP